MVAGEVVPKEAGPGIVDIGLIVFERIFVGDGAPEVVGAFVAAVGDLPGFFVVVAGNGGCGPDVAVAGDFSAVIEVVEDAELAGGGVVGGGGVCTAPWVGGGGG